MLSNARPARGHASRLGQRLAIVLRVDGGMVASDWTMQRSPTFSMRRWSANGAGTTALGAAWLAGTKRACCRPDGFARLWKLDRAFKPSLAAANGTQVRRLEAVGRGRARARCPALSAFNRE